MSAQVTPLPINNGSTTTENPLREVRVINPTEESAVAEMPPYPSLDVLFSDTRVRRTFRLHADMKLSSRMLGE